MKERKRLAERVIRGSGDWGALRDGFAWRVPGGFSIAEACCDRWALAEPERVAIVDRGGGARRVWSYGALKDASDRLATTLAGLDVARGDRVAVLLPQQAEVMVAHFAVLKLGAIVLPLFSLFGAEALAVRLSDSGAKVVVTDRLGLERLRAVASETEVTTVIVTDWNGNGDGDRGPFRQISWAAAVLADPLAATVPVQAEDPGVLIYTSGTTGPPKGALHAHRFLIGHLPCVELSLERFPKPGDVGWSPADWAWIGALMDMALPCLYHGVPLVAERRHKFDPAAAWDLMVEEGVSVAFLPPTALKLMRQIEVPKGHRLRAVNTGGESLAPDLLTWGDRSVGAVFNELYGQTECNLVICSAQGDGVRRVGAMGRAVPGHEVVVLRPDGAVCAVDEVGEICVRAPDPVMFLGYWNRPEATNAKIRDGWLRTGDLGRCDGDGYFTYVARDDDIITSAGYRIGPTEIENCLLGDADVVMAAVVGLPDPLRTEAVTAFVVLRPDPGRGGVEARLIKRVRDNVSPHAAPRRVVFVEDLPMTATGKIMRRALREAWG